MDWSAETVEGLAPDAASVTAARKLARPAPWSATGYDERAVWGLCKGSGARPYQTQVDLSGPAYKCSCPSRKFPCKHALALLLLRAGGDVAAGARAGVGGRVAGVARRARARAARGRRRASRRATPRPRPGARRSARRAWRRASRTCGRGCATRCAAGSARGGCAPGRSGTRSRRGSSTRRRRARRRGCARWAASPPGGPDGWPERLLSGLGLLHLLCEAFAREDGPVRDDVRALLGFNVAREDVLAGPRVQRPLDRARAGRDRAGAPARAAHVAVGRGDRPARAAARLRAAGRAAGAAPGARAWRCEAALAFHPSATPLRALVAEPRRARTARRARSAPAGRSEALRTVADAVAANPWLDEWPVVLARGRAGRPRRRPLDG